MKKRKNRSKRIFFKLYNFLICCFLLLPIFDMARIWITNMIDTKIHYDNIQVVDSSGVAVEVYEAPQPSYDIKEIVLKTMFDFSRSNDHYDTYVNSVTNYTSNVAWNNFNNYYSFTFTNLDFLRVFGYTATARSNAIVTYLFVNWYINWLLDITLVCFIPYVLLCISQWFMSLTEDLTTRTNKEDY